MRKKNILSNLKYILPFINFNYYHYLNIVSIYILYRYNVCIQHSTGQLSISEFLPGFLNTSYLPFVTFIL